MNLCPAHLGGKCCHYEEGHQGKHRIWATGEQVTNPGAIETKNPWGKGTTHWIEFEKGDDDEKDLDDGEQG